MKKALFKVLTLLMSVCFIFAFATACNPSSSNKEEEPAIDSQILAVYESYLAYADERGTTPLSYDEWLRSVKGEKGEATVIEISEDGYWVLDGVKTPYSALGQKGDAGEQGPQGPQGQPGEQGPQGQDGVGIEKMEIDSDGNLIVYYTNAPETGVNLGKVKGADGSNGVNGEDGADGIGIVDAEIDADGNLVIYYSNAPETGVVVGGVKGEDGIDGIDGVDGIGISNVEIDADGNLVIYYSDDPTTGVIIGNVKGEDGEDGEDFIGGMAISEITLNSDNDLVITFTNGLETVIEMAEPTGERIYMAITMGADRVVRITLASGYTMNYGTLAKIVLRENGEIVAIMESGAEVSLGAISISTPHIGENGNWWIGDTDTGVPAGPVEVEHNWGEWVIFIEPSCEPGFKARECLDCGETEVKIIAADHDYTSYAGKQPTCTEIGWEEYQVCNTCGYSTYVELPALGHDSEWVTVTEATCVDNGLKQLICNTCHLILDQEIISAIGHESDGEKCIHCGLYEYTITVNYVYSDGTEALDSVSETVWQGDEYSFVSPDLEGYVVDKLIVTGIANSNEEIDVTYSPIAIQEIVRIDSVDLGSVNYNTPFSALALPSTVTGYTASGREVRLSVYWDSSSYSPSTYGSQEIDGLAVAGYGYVLTCDNYVTATLNIASNVIAQINPMDLGRLPLNTSYAGLGLPTTAAVTTTTGAVYYLPVTWNEYDYDSSVAGEHEITGTITLEEGFSLAAGVENLATISFELSERMYGTADIVFIVDTTGSMWGEIQNVKNNIVRFAERLEEEGVSVRWALLEYRDITCDGANSTKVIYCGASEWYINVHAYEQAIARLNVNGGGDREETVIDALKAATYLEDREDAKTFYIVVTDADYKVNNNYGVASMGEMINELVNAETVTSVVTKPMFYGDYRTLTDRTNGILANIDGDFASELWRLCDLITEEVVYGDVERIEIIKNPDKLSYVAGDYFDGSGMIVRAYFETGLTRDVTGYSVNPYSALQVADTEVEINYRGKVATISITVSAPEIAVDSVSTSVTTLTLTVGETATVTATVYPENAVNKNVVWTTINPNVAVVSNGVIEAIGVGETQIIVTTLDGGHTATIVVTVNPIPVAVQGIIANIGAVELEVGETAEVEVTIFPIDATNKNVIWSTTDSTVATVSNGVITAVGGGTATIVATTEDGGYKARIYVVVNEDYGTVNGRVYSSSNSSLLSGVTVKLYLGGTLIESTTTDSSGNYRFEDLAFDTYQITFEKTNYITANTTCVVDSETIQLDNVYLVLDTSRLPGIAVGYAKNASTTSGISDITVYVRSGNGNTTGTVIKTVTTNSSGYYTTGELNPGNYTLHFVDNSSRTTKYTSTYINVTITGNTTSYNNDASMALPISSGTIKVVLTWGASPRDLDSHLLIDSGRNGTCDYHVYYGSKVGGGAELDVDDTSSYGPETTTITLRSNTKYVYYVYNFSGESSCKIQNSSAKVQIYIGDQVYTYNVPNGTGPNWKVFSYDTATGEFTFYNQVTSTSPGV